jgi:hypothetical protein
MKKGTKQGQMLLGLLWMCNFTHGRILVFLFGSVDLSSQQQGFMSTCCSD